MKMRKLVTCIMLIVISSVASLAIAGGKSNAITGTVKTTAGAAISGATVSNGTVTATTTTAGVYTLSNVRAGINTVTASKTGYTTVSHPVTAPKSGTVTVDFILSTAVVNGTITGTVKNSATGAVISGATVSDGTASTSTNTSGVYSLSVAAGSYTVTASKTGYATSSLPATVTSGGTTTLNFSLATAVASNYRVIAWNDLGMHCACPTWEGFLLLPPYNTVRAQVMDVSGRDPVFIDQALATSLGLVISYAMVENTDANLEADPYFASWITNSPKIFPGFQPVLGGMVVCISGKGLAGTVDYNATLLDWKAEGVPAYPALTGDRNKDIMTDPFGGANRDPYLTANVYVKNASGNVLAQTTTVVPVAFGGCCNCHLALATANGYPATPAGSFQFLGKMHGQNSSKIDFAKLDPTGDGTGGPIRCSWCHWDPAIGDSAAPGLPAVWPNYVIMAGAGFTKADVKISQYSFSDVLHRYHAQDALVLSTYDPNVAVNCYDCHPGNGVNCYGGTHITKTSPSLWCVDCHGNLNQRVAAGQMAQPWQQSTLPSCSSASPGATPAFACHSRTTAGGTSYPGLFGTFINGRGHKGSPGCQTCHGSAHAEAPATQSLDNVQLSNIQSDPSYSFPAGKDKTYALGVCIFCHPGKTNVWGVPPH